jgi:arylsulfatase
MNKEIDHIFVIALDAARKDHLGIYGYKRNTTPNLDKLAEKSIVFDNAYSVSSWTTPTFTSVFTGLLPTTHGVLKYPKPKDLDPKIETLGEKLEKRGWQGFGFHGGAYANGEFGFNRGFKKFSSKGRRFKDNIDDIKSSIVQNKDKKTFYFLHGFDCHRPYQPENKFDLFDNTNSDYKVSQLYMPKGDLPKTEEDIDKVIAKYDGSIKMADHYLGQIISTIEKVGLMNRSMIFVLADHGEEFNEHGYYDHTQTLYEEVVRVPLLTYLPSQTNRRESKPVSLVDLPTTIAQYLGYVIKKSEGLSLLKPKNNRVIYLATGYEEDYLKKDQDSPKEKRKPLLKGLIKGKFKIIFDKKMKAKELYNLDGDPSETTNIRNQKPKLATSLIKEAAKNSNFYKLKSQDFERSTVKQFEDKMKNQLKKLGYF